MTKRLRWHSGTQRANSAQSTDTQRLAARLIAKGRTRAAEELLGLGRNSLSSASPRKRSTPNLLTPEGRAAATARLPDSMRRGFQLEGPQKARFENNRCYSGETSQQELDKMKGTIRSEAVKKAFGLTDPAPPRMIGGRLFVGDTPAKAPSNSAHAGVSGIVSAAGKRVAAIIGGA